MGTNYYHHKEPACQTCGRPHEGRHIGKSSAGWCFSLHVIPEDGIVDLADWQRVWAEGGEIRNEYGELIAPADMLKRITERGGAPTRHLSSAFHERNGSEEGPNGLLRHRISRHCIGHGAGTWDRIIGEFS